MHNPDPRQHEVHELPLADRIITKSVSDWMSIAFAIARSGNGYSGPEAQGFDMCLDEMQFLHLSGFQYSLVPSILDQLRRAGLLTTGDKNA